MMVFKIHFLGTTFDAFKVTMLISLLMSETNSNNQLLLYTPSLLLFFARLDLDLEQEHQVHLGPCIKKFRKYLIFLICGVERPESMKRISII